MKNWKSSLVLAMAIFVTGCSTYRQPGVDSLAKQDIAVIETDPCEGFRCLAIQEIDGKWRGVGWIKRYELAPGLRNIKFIYNAPGIVSQGAIVVEFIAEPGHTYGIRANAHHGQMTWAPEVFDKSSQLVVSKFVRKAFAY